MASIANQKINFLTMGPGPLRGVLEADEDYGSFEFTKADDASGPFNVGDRLTVRQTGEHGAFVSDHEMYYLGRDENGFFASFAPQDYPGYYFSSSFVPAGTILTMDESSYPVCFVLGTVVETPRGPLKIESLVPGDLVRTLSGWGVVKWLGWRAYGSASLRTTEQKIVAAPVRIRANAITENVPSSDLLVSPWHHVMVDGHLVRANDLINGTTIVQETHVTSVDYYHVELEQFDVIMAHGIYSESWADGGNRSFFQNADVTALRPTDFKRRRASRPGFDHLVLRKGKKLEAIQKKVAERARRLSKQETAIAKAA